MSTPERIALTVVEEADVIEAGIATADPEQLATLAGWLGRMTALVQLRIVGVGRAPSIEPDRVLDVKDVAKRLKQSPSWVYAHRGELVECRANVPGRLKFSERRLEKYLERRGA